MNRLSLSRGFAAFHLMRILYISAVSVISGAEVGLCDLLRNLDKGRFVAQVLSPGRGPLEDKLRKIGIEPHVLPMRRFQRTKNIVRIVQYLFHLLINSRRIASISKANRIDLIHANGIHAQLYAAIAARLAGIPNIWHVRDMTKPGILERMILRWTTIAIVPSEAVRKPLQDHSEQKIIRIYNGIDVEEFTSPLHRSSPEDRHAKIDSLKKEFGIEPDDFSILMIAQLVPWKGHETFIRAASLVAQARPNTKFVLVGSDLFGTARGYTSKLQKLRDELRLEPIMKFAGHRADVAQIIAMADVVVLTSHNEPFGRVLLEAMALGKPVVASNGAGPLEIVVDGESGLLVDSSDPKDISRAIIELADHPTLRESMGAKGRSRLDESFTIEQHVKEIEALYTELQRNSRQ